MTNRTLAGLFSLLWLLLSPLNAGAAGPTSAWIPAAKAPGHISPVGGVRVRARGNDLHITGYVGATRGGKPGFKTIEAVRPGGAVDAPRDPGAARARDALAQIIDIVPQAYVRPAAAETTVRNAMAGLLVGKASDRSGLYRQAGAAVLGALKDPYTFLTGPPPQVPRASSGGHASTTPAATAAKKPRPIVTSKLRQGGVGVIRLRSFQSGVGAEVSRTIDELARRNGAPLRGLVLDLRGNGGGVTSAALAIADDLIREGTIMRTTGARGREIQRFEATGRATHADVPLTVLADRGSASSAEILTSALQSTGRARFLGERTYGKGVGQIYQPLEDASTLHLTVTRHDDGTGASWQGKGLKPDLGKRAILRAARGTKVVDPVMERAIADLR